MNPSSAELLKPPSATRFWRQPSYGAMTIYAVATVTALRLLWLSVQTTGLYPDEAQYWFWSRHLALGYYSKPPLVAWLIALTTALFGNGEFAVRLSAPLLHAVAAGFVYAIAARLYDRRVGYWAALSYVTVPGISLSAFLISTDAVLLPCWAAALYGFIRARDSTSLGWWIVTGAALGLGMLAKYAMAYWLISAALVLLPRADRRRLTGFLTAAAIGMLIYLPNLLWNWQHGFATYLHVRDNAAVHGLTVHPLSLIEFVLSQVGAFGPIFFATTVALCLRPARYGGAPARLLATFTWPVLAIILTVSFLSHAEPNWAAPAYVSAVVMVIGTLLRAGWRRTVVLSVALHIAAAVALFGASEVIARTDIDIPAKYDPLHRLRGWDDLGNAVAAALAQHPGLRLMADDRELLAALIYYVHPHPFDAVEWDPIPGVSDQWSLQDNLGKLRGASFLAVTEHDLAAQMRPDFDSLTEIGTIDIRSGPGGGRRYTLYIASGYRGDPARRG